jgi:hypothetical protein
VGTGCQNPINCPLVRSLPLPRVLMHHFNTYIVSILQTNAILLDILMHHSNAKCIDFALNLI